jgi:hypothetical protein
MSDSMPLVEIQACCRPELHGRSSSVFTISQVFGSCDCGMFDLQAGKRR